MRSPLSEAIWNTSNKKMLNSRKETRISKKKMPNWILN